MTEREDYNRMISTLLTRAFEALERAENSSGSPLETQMAFACEAIEHVRELREQRDYWAPSPMDEIEQNEVLERARAKLAAMSPEEKKKDGRRNACRAGERLIKKRPLPLGKGGGQELAAWTCFG